MKEQAVRRRRDYCCFLGASRSGEVADWLRVLVALPDILSSGSDVLFQYASVHADKAFIHKIQIDKYVFYIFSISGPSFSNKKAF